MIRWWRAWRERRYWRSVGHRDGRYFHECIEAIRAVDPALAATTQMRVQALIRLPTDPGLEAFKAKRAAIFEAMREALDTALAEVKP